MLDFAVEVMEMLKRATVYLEPRIHHAVKIKAAQTASTISHLINEAICLALREDALDLQAIEKRKREPARSFEAVLADLKRDGLL